MSRAASCSCSLEPEFAALCTPRARGATLEGRSAIPDDDEQFCRTRGWDELCVAQKLSLVSFDPLSPRAERTEAESRLLRPRTSLARPNNARSNPSIRPVLCVCVGTITSGRLSQQRSLFITVPRSLPSHAFSATHLSDFGATAATSNVKRGSEPFQEVAHNDTNTPRKSKMPPQA